MRSRRPHVSFPQHVDPTLFSGPFDLHAESLFRHSHIWCIHTCLGHVLAWVPILFANWPVRYSLVYQSSLYDLTPTLHMRTWPSNKEETKNPMPSAGDWMPRPTKGYLIDYVANINTVVLDCSDEITFIRKIGLCSSNERNNLLGSGQPKETDACFCISCLSNSCQIRSSQLRGSHHKALASWFIDLH